MVTRRRAPISLRRHLGKFAMTLPYVLRRDKPLLLLRTLRNYAALAATGGRPRLRYVDLAVTYRCNFDCVHCSASRLGDPARREMTVEDYRRLGDDLAAAGVLVVQITGGEPVLRPDLEAILTALGPDRFFISMGTNARLLDRARLASLRRAGLDNLCVSIDDWDEAEHDRWRGEEGTHRRALEVIDLAAELDLRVMVFWVATHQNVRGRGFEELIEYTRRKGALLLVGWAVPTGNWNANQEVLLTPDDLDYLEQVHERHLHVRTDFEANYLHFGCGAGKEKLYVTAYGDVVPCAFVHIRFGNVFEKPIEEIRRTAMRIDWFRDYNGLCLAANDREFQARHLSKIYTAGHEPITMREAGFDVDE